MANFVMFIHICRQFDTVLNEDTVKYNQDNHKIILHYDNQISVSSMHHYIAAIATWNAFNYYNNMLEIKLSSPLGQMHVYADVFTQAVTQL